MMRTGETECPNCGYEAEWNEDSNIECTACGIVKTELVDSDPYVVEHRLDNEVVDRVKLDTCDSFPDNYRFVAACKKCGVCDDRIVPYSEAVSDGPLNDDPAMRHHERTEHTCVLVNYTTAPTDIQEMLDDGHPDKIDLERIMEFMAGGNADTHTQTDRSDE
jgi:hypothetical protein